MLGVNLLVRSLVCWLLLSYNNVFVSSHQETHVQVAEDVFLHVLEYGDSSQSSDKVVLLVHGFPDLSLSWQYQAELLAEAGYLVVTPDLRGFGSSSIPKGGIAAYGRQSMVSDLNALREHYCGENGSFAMIAGHDWGGAIVWSTLEAFGDEERGPPIAKSAIILNAPHFRILFDFITRPLQALKSWYMAFIQIPWLPEQLLSKTSALYYLIKWHLDIDPMTSRIDIDHNLEVYKTVLTDYDRIHAMITPYRAAAAGFWREIEDSTLLNVVERLVQWIQGIDPNMTRQEEFCKASEDENIRITIPTLILWGEHDIALSNDLAKPPPYVMDHFEGAEFFDAGHLVHWDKPQEIAERMIQFANAHNGRGGESSGEVKDEA